MTVNDPIKVLLVDDESIVRRGLKATVDWARYNMQVVADAPNGQKGWEAFLEFKPEVIITDIVMPEMDGIELARRVKRQCPNAKVLLLSCHRDFEYAQQGIAIGASGYLLKTSFEDEELDFFLSKFKDELSAVMKAVEVMPHDDRDRWDASFYAWLCGFRNEFRSELLSRWNEHWSWMNEPHEVYLAKLFPSGGSAELGRDQASSNSASQAHLLWEEVVGQFKQEYKQDGFLEMVPCGADRCFYMVSQKKGQKLEHVLKEWKHRNADFYWSRSAPIQGMEAWLQTVTMLHQEAELEKQFELRTYSWPETITLAVRLTADNLREPWSVSDLAHRVGLSRSHFSTLFKKVTGENYVSFLYRMRLKTAKNLLSNTPMTLQEVAEQIGMVDGKYLSKWFKRCCGMTPTQFRNGQKAE
ncbi:response regulator [Paenibacillus sp. UMB4589-SE434]|uniref:response regulator transcription factor n=1 Tax=Paenibacillus sp. UMB4589-SE434 TaxID=3046314 RepID=UPI00255029FF|nr:response regulator [Paenibacillus sp. UMB4589-SE434]MDK8183199.1 response regulator [Paenibacillus sp. UMB4589-SE434]